MSLDFDYSIVRSGVNATTWFVYFTQRLQHWGSDTFLYANTGFKTPEGCNVEPLLARLIDIAREDDSGIQQMRIEPFTLVLYGGAIQEARIERMVTTAAHAAKLEAVNITAKLSS